MTKSELDTLKNKAGCQCGIEHYRSSDILLMCSKNEEVRFAWHLNRRVCKFVTDYFNITQKAKLIVRDITCFNANEKRLLKKNGKIEKTIKICGVDFPVCIHSEDGFTKEETDETYLIDVKLPIDKSILKDVILSVMLYDDDEYVFSNQGMASFAEKKMNSENKYEKTIADIIVLLNPIKQNELAEKLYNDIDKNLKQGKIKTEFYEYQSYLVLIDLYKSFTFLKQCGKNDTSLVKSIGEYSGFGLDYDVFMRNVEKGIIRIEREYGKKLLHIQENSFEKYGVSVRAAVWIHNLTV